MPLIRPRDAIVLLAIVGGVVMTGAAHADMVQLYAAGSLRTAFNDVSTAFRTMFSIAVQAKYGPSGILKDEIAQGAKADVTGGPSSVQPPAGRNAYAWHVAEGRADIFLAYCTATRDALQQHPDQQSVALPDALSVAADYGLTVINGAGPYAQKFADYIVSVDGQRILSSHGFAPGHERTP